MPTTTQTLQKGRFSIEQELLVVGPCTHFQAYDTEDDESVSIFEIVPQLPKVATVSQRDELEAAFTAKARSVSLLKKKAFPLVIDYFSEAGRHYLVTNCVGGTDLYSIVGKRETAFSAEQLADWADTLLEGLAALHGSRPVLVYKNLNPQNVVLGQDESVRLSILGLFQPTESMPKLSAAGGAAGSMLAFSPLEQIWSGLDAASQKVIINQYDEPSEKVLKQDLDARSDIYSLGATLYFLSTGRIPVDALERSIEMIEGNPDPLISPNKLDQSVPTEVSDVIMKAMEIRREYRFDSAAIMRQVLKTAMVRIKERGADVSIEPQRAEHNLTETRQNGRTSASSADEAAQRLREAEEKRLEAERRAAEAERRLREAEQARVTDSFNLSQVEDDVLGLLSSTPPNPSGSPSTDGVEADPLAAAAPADAEINTDAILDDAVLPRKPDQKEAFADISLESAAASSLPSDETEPDPPSASVASEPAASVVPSFGADTLFHGDSYASKRSFGLPMIAVAAVVVIVAVAGGWFMLGGPSRSDASSIQAQPAVTEENPVEPPVQNDYPPTETSQPPAAETSVEAPVAGDEQAVTPPDRTAPAKTRKSAPARTPVPKKAVTVDDLINDN